MKTIHSAKVFCVLVSMLGLFALMPAQGVAQVETTDVVLSLNHFLYDLEADCTPLGFSYPVQYVEWSMVQGSHVVPGPRTMLRASSTGTIADPRRPRQTCGRYAIGSGGDDWQPLQDVKLSGTFDRNAGLITVTIEMFDKDGGTVFDPDNQLDLTRPDGKALVFTIDPKTLGWFRPIGEPYCNTPDPACPDNEGQWCGACNDAQGCCATGDPNLIRGYAFRGDGHGAGLSWSVAMTQRNCGARLTLDTDRDGLWDDWELHGYDHDCDGTIDLPFHTWGANPMHRDIFIEYDACMGQRISKQEIVNPKAAFANAPVDATGFENPDHIPGINVHVDTGEQIDLLADEGGNTCSDGINNDNDLFVDFADPSCLSGLQEAAGPCNDGIDNDGNGPLDIAGTCKGEDANGAPIAKVEGIRGNCNDKKSNNDGDLLIDASDPQCRAGDNLGGGRGDVVCPAWGIPSITDDFLDVKRKNFNPIRHGKFRYALRWPRSGKQSKEDGVVGGCGTPADESQNGLTDKDDPVCMFAREDGLHFVGGPGDCHDNKDNDGDGQGDLFDPQCTEITELPSTELVSCYDGKDNGDGANEKDPDCKSWGGYSDGFDNIAIFEDDDGGYLLMHELGHTLGLHHGGAGNPENYKPNYLSVMNYLYSTGVPQDPDAMAEDFTSMSEDGHGGGPCFDRIDNDGDGLIDSLDSNCRMSCSDGVDNDGDGLGAGGGIASRDALDPECRGIDVENDGIAERLQLDFSPQSMQRGAGRSVLSPVMPEAVLFESEPFVTIDVDHDGMQDFWGDALNMIRFRRYLPGNAEGSGTCSDGIDNDGNHATDSFDSKSCRSGILPAPAGSRPFASYIELPRTGERMLRPSLTWLPVGFDWNDDGDVNDIVAADMDEDEDPDNDADDPLHLLTDFDDWRNMKILMSTRHFGAAPAPLLGREPSGPEMIEIVRQSRPADLVLDSATTRIVPAANGTATLTVEVENIEPTDAYGPVTFTLGALPAGITATASGGRCWPQNNETVCVRDRMRGYEVWTLSFALQGDLCSWRSSAINVRVQHSGGVELNPEDNTLAVAVGGAGTWSQWRQCPSHWGASSFTGPSTLSAPQVVWTGAAILNTPVIDDAGDIYIADSAGFVRKMAPNGASRWVSTVLGVVRAGPALTPAGTIVVATEDGRIRALSQATGLPVWSYPIPTNVLSSLVVAGDRLYAVTQFGLGLADSVFAFDINGNFLWSRQLSGPIVAAPTVGANGTIYVSVASGLFYSPAALTAVSASGTVLWSRTLDGDARDTPVQRNGRVYVGTSTRRVYAFDAVSGAQAWMYTTPCLFLEACEISGSPAALPSNQLAVGSAGGRVHVIRDAGASATLVRSIAASGLFLGGPRDSMVVGQNNIAYVGNKNAQLRALNLTSGTQISLVSMKGNAVGAVALDGQGRLYVGTSNGFLYRY